MIIIFSEKGDGSTDDVMDCIHSIGKKCIRINTGDPIESIFFEISNSRINFSFSHQGQRLHSEHIESVWFRRGEISPPEMLMALDKMNSFEAETLEHLLHEWNSLCVGLYYALGKQNCIGSPFHYQINKLFCLQKALEAGLAIPDSAVVSTANQVQQIAKTNPKLIVKDIQDAEPLVRKSEVFYRFTENLMIEQDFKSEGFFPTFIQKKIIKELEIRCFYLKGQCYSMAIYSQKDFQTETDFRNYNDDWPNRVSPYQLPNELEKKISVFMESIYLDSGSLDILLNPEGNYFFLEVNPAGQFEMVSTPCNYRLEEKIAQILCNYE